MMSPYIQQLWQDELNRLYAQRLEFMASMPPAPKVGWCRGQWNLALWRWSMFREWLGEKIAGRRFSDDY